MTENLGDTSAGAVSDSDGSSSSNLPGLGRVHWPKPTPECAVSCRGLVVTMFAERGIEAHVTSEPPIVMPRYEPLMMACPHGVEWFAEPTGDQIAEWNREGVE